MTVDLEAVRAARLREDAVTRMAAFFRGDLLLRLPPEATPLDRIEADRLARLTATMQIWVNGTHYDGDTSWLSLEEFCLLNDELQDGLAKFARAPRDALIFANAAAFHVTAAHALDVLAEDEVR